MLHERRRDPEVAPRTCEPLATGTVLVERLAGDRKPRWKEPDRLVRRQERIAAKLRVSGDPQGLFRAKRMPAVRAMDLVEEASAHGGHPGS
jgi:hypothetical protein